MKTQLKTILSAAILAVAITFTPAAAAQNSGDRISSNYLVGSLLVSGVGCAAGAALAVNKKDRGAVCGVVALASFVVYQVIVGTSGNNAAPDSRWSFDGGDGMPKAVYSLSDAAKLSFGAKGESLDYDGIAIGVKYSF